MKKPQSKLDPNKIQITKIQIFKANLESSDEFLEQPKKVQSFKIDVGQEMAHNLTDRMVRIRLFFTIKGVDESQNQPLGIEVNYGIEYLFKVENLYDLMQVTPENKENMHLDLAATLFSMAYSTSRGIVLERTQGTFVGGVILPVVDPLKILSDSTWDNSSLLAGFKS